MEPFKRILATTDFSEPGNHAISAAFRLAEELDDATVILVHVIEPPPLNPIYGMYTPEPPWRPEDVPRLAAAVRDRLLSLVPAEAQGGPIKILAETPFGSTVELILDAARQHAADVIVVGTHGRRGLPRMLLGSVTERIVRLADRPVLVVH